MRRILVVLALVAGAIPASAGSSTNPDFVRDWQGRALTVTEVSCDTTTTALLAASLTGNSMSLTFCNIGATNFVNICPAATCTAATGKKLLVDTCFTFDRAVISSVWSCLANSAAVTVEIVNEKSQ